MYACAICGTTSSEESASGICILGGRRDVTVMSLHGSENLLLDQTAWLTKIAFWIIPIYYKIFHCVSADSDKVDFIIFVCAINKRQYKYIVF